MDGNVFVAPAGVYSFCQEIVEPVSRQCRVWVMGMLKRFPSGSYVVSSAVSTFGRFPLGLGCAIVGTVAAVVLVEMEAPEAHPVLLKLLMVSALGIPLAVAAATLGEGHWQSRKAPFALQAVGALLLTGYYLFLPDNPLAPLAHPVRVVLMIIGLHFLVAFAPFVFKGQVHSFWQYNISLFRRVIFAALYSAVLFAGLSIALAAADYLFGLEVLPNRYVELWILIVGLFNTWYFLAGVPEDPGALNESQSYPKALQVLAQFILLPLVVLYFVILVSYEAKIIITWNWPKGLVSQLVLWYSVVGLLALLLLHPLQERSESRWIKVFARWFFRALIPLVAMLFLAILTRISDYGFTENRFFVLAMAIGLVVVTMYFLISSTKDLRVVPVILCGISFLSAFGPWSASAVSYWSQRSRLESLLIENNRLSEITAGIQAGEVPFEDRKEMSNIVAYLTEWHGMRPFRGWIADSTLAALDTAQQHLQPSQIAQVLGFTWVAFRHHEDTEEYFSINATYGTPAVISAYDLLLDYSSSSDDTLGSTYQGVGFSAHVLFDRRESTLLLVMTDDGAIDSGTVALPLSDLVSTSIASPTQGYLPLDQLSFELASTLFDAKIILRNISGRKGEEELRVTHLDGQVLIRRR